MRASATQSETSGEEQERHPERSFCHVLDHGKYRRATLHGPKNLTKRHLAAAFTHNLSLLMRHLTGHGTAKQWLATTGSAFFA